MTWQPIQLGLTGEDVPHDLGAVDREPGAVQLALETGSGGAAQGSIFDVTDNDTKEGTTMNGIEETARRLPATIAVEVRSDRVLDASGAKVIIPAITREGDTIAFKCGAELAQDQRGRRDARRLAVAWMAANPKLQKGVRRYRFDAGDVRDAF